MNRMYRMGIGVVTKSRKLPRSIFGDDPISCQSCSSCQKNKTLKIPRFSPPGKIPTCISCHIQSNNRRTFFSDPGKTRCIEGLLNINKALSCLMDESTRILIIASCIYLVIAVVGYYFGLAFDKSKQVYEILAYLVLYQAIVFLILINPLSGLSVKLKTGILTIAAFVILGQILNDSRAFYPFTSWNMYSKNSNPASVLNLQAIDREGVIVLLKTGYFSPARSSRPHASKFTSIVRTRDTNDEDFKILMTYYCRVLNEKGIISEIVQVIETYYTNPDIARESHLLTEFYCITQ